jgi:hypothetical protein
MSFTRSDLHEYCHRFALATIESLSAYLLLLEDVVALIDAPENDDARTAAVRKQSLRMLINLAPLSTTLSELDLDSRLAELEADDDVRSVQVLMQAVIDAAGVLAFVETRSELENTPLLTPDTVGRLLQRDCTEAKLAAHFLKETGRTLPPWPDWPRE